METADLAIDAPGRIPIAELACQVILNSIVRGELAAGDSIVDHVWAQKLGVSRTPVREGIQRLTALGLIDVAPARFTRLRSFAYKDALQEANDWAALHRATVSSLLPSATQPLLDQLREVANAYVEAGDNEAKQNAANFAFFQILRQASTAFSMRLGATSVAYRLRLAEPSLPGVPEGTAELHSSICSSLASGTPDAAQRAFSRWTHELSVGIALVA